MRKYYLLSFIAVIAAALRIPILPEIETIILILLAVLSKKDFIYGLIIVFASNHYAIMDAVYRFNGDMYPSIYTKTMVGGIKYLDILIVLLFLLNIKKIVLVRRLVTKELPILLVIFSLFSFLFADYGNFAFNQLLFFVRSLLIIYTVYVNLVDVSRKTFVDYSKLAIVTWGFNMFFSILIPQENPLYRTFLGFNGYIFFAGDEYLTLGIYACIIVLISVKDKKKDGKFLFGWLVASFIACMVSQRKGAIPYFLIIGIILFLYNKKGKALSTVVKCGLIIYEFAQFIFIGIVYNILPMEMKEMFYDYHELLLVSIASIEHIKDTNLLKYLIGISPFGKYEIQNLVSRLDYSTAFGDEVGEKFRYTLWSIPGGRVILNCGIFGFVYRYLYMFWKAVQSTSELEFYLLTNVIGLFCFANITPVMATGIGAALAFLVNKNMKDRYEKNEAGTII